MTPEKLFADWDRRLSSVGLSLVDLRKEAGVHPANFHNWRTGKGGITLTSVARLEAAVAALEAREARAA